MCDVDYDQPTIWKCWAPRARKPHKCDECGLFVQPGESYARAKALTDGEWWDGVRCAACWFLCQAIETLECGDEGSVLWGGLSEEIGQLDSGPYNEETDEFAPNWAEEAFGAIVSRPRAEARP